MTTLRADDFSLTDEQSALIAAFRDLLDADCPSSRVRAAEDSTPPGHDAQLWKQALTMGAVSMAVPVARGGDGASLVDLVLVAEEMGRRLAPVPYVDAVAAARLLAATPGPAGEWLDDLMTGARHVAVALAPLQPGARQLVPSGALATGVAGLDGDRLILLPARTVHPAPRNLSCSPLAWWNPDDGAPTVLATGGPARRAYADAVTAWKLLTAACLVGVGEAALRLGIEHAKVRRAFGVPIGAFQAISHALVDAATALAGARRLVWKAAWFAEHEPAHRLELVPMAFLRATQVATEACGVAIHVHGGVGVTTESDLPLHLRRAKGWALVAGDPRRELTLIGDLLGDRT